MNNPDVRVLTYFEAGGAISVTAGLPKKTPKGVTRQMLVVKPIAAKVEKPMAELLFNEMGGGEPLEYLQRMLGVYVPILANPKLGLGDVMSHEVNATLHNFLYSVTTTVGHVKGETFLPLPPLDQASTRSLTLKERINLLEGCVSAWTKQIKFLLNLDPEAAFKATSHPLPDAELTFWRNKAAQLDAVFEQLQSERLRRVLQYLDTNQSTFCEPFAKLCKEVFAARGEAKDNVKFLATVQGYVTQLISNSDFGELPALFRPLMHTLLLIWKHSKFYNTPARLVVFIRQVINAIIAASQRFLLGKTVTETLMDEAAASMLPKINTLLRVAGEFKRVYFLYKANAATECPGNPWRISNIALFSRLDAFLERCHDVLEVASVVVTYRQLEKVVIGGLKGKELTDVTDGVYAEFKGALLALDQVPYDILDCDVAGFAGDLATFKAKVAVLDRRLATTLVQAFEDAGNLYSRFKLMDIYNSLLERPLVAAELEKLHIAMVKEFGSDLRAVQEIFLSERSAPPIPSNQPPVAGSLRWSIALRDRVGDPMVRIKQLSREVLARDETREVIQLYTSFFFASEQFDAERLAAWGSDLERSSDEKLRMFVLRVREGLSVGSGAKALAGGGGGGEGGGGAAVGGGGEGKEGGEEGAGAAQREVQMLETNFDPSLVRMLREVKYFLLLGLEVPNAALQIFMKAETYRRWTGSLDVIVGQHNTILEEMLPVEVPLLISHLSKMSATIAQGLTELNWKSPAVEPFITDASTCVKTAYDILYILKQSLREIVHEMESWSKEPMLTRKAKPLTPEEFEASYKAVRTARYASIQDGGKMVLKKLKEMETLLKLPKTSSKDWGVYVDFVNGIVVQGLQKLVTGSLQKLCDLINPEKIKRYQELPLLVIDLQLPEGSKELKYKPDVHEKVLPPGAPTPPPSQQTLYDIINNWVLSFYHVAKCFKRMDDNEGKYLKEIMDDLEVKTYLVQLADFLARAEASAVEFQHKFDQFSDLWTKSVPEELEAFISRSYYELPKTEEQLQEESESQGSVPQPQPRVPELVKFEEEILRYQSMAEAVGSLKTATDLSWLRVNSTPVKRSLETLVARFSDSLKAHLQEVLVTRVNDLASFIAGTTSGLEIEVTGEDSAALMKVMGVLLDVKQSRYYRKAMIAPLRNIFKLLKRNGSEGLDDLKIAGSGASFGPNLLVEYLDQAELLLHDAVYRSFGKKEEIFTLQNAEMQRVKERAMAFDDSVRKFWNGFRKDAPYNFAGHVDEAYKQLDGFYKELVALEKGTLELNAVEALFELPTSKFAETGQCRVQLKLLKSVWDFKAFVLSTYDSWRLALWSDINTDLLEGSNKNMSAELKKLGEGGPMVKAWQLYKDVEVMVKDMSTTLPLVNELHSPAMRPRHWAQLASVCGVKSLDPTDSKFSLDDMLVLKLHTHGEESSEIVDTANKELKIEKKMDEIETAWKGFNLEFVQWKDMDLTVVKATDEVQEALDAHQMELQSIVGMGKVMEFFRARVDLAQKNLGCVEEVLKEWLSVTRNWGSLEVIFLASADIRAQLPEETKIFEGIDSAFKELMKGAVDTTNVVEACTKEGRGEALKGMTRDLEMCQRKLNDYLDKKKKLYPRFYFVSNVALLDILSNGNNPPKIMPYLVRARPLLAAAPHPPLLAPSLFFVFLALTTPLPSFLVLSPPPPPPPTSPPLACAGRLL
jgi:dynein heavy chain